MGLAETHKSWQKCRKLMPSFSLFCSLSISLCLYSVPNLLFIQASFSAVMIKSIIQYPEQTFQFCLWCFLWTCTLSFIMDWVGIFLRTNHYRFTYGLSRCHLNILIYQIVIRLCISQMYLQKTDINLIYYSCAIFKYSSKCWC